MKYLKQNFILKITLALGVVFFMSSCQKDIDKKLEGNWNYTWKTETTSSTGSGSETLTGVVTFNSDGTGEMDQNGEDESMEFKWKNNGESQVVMTFDEDPEVPGEGLDEVTWEVNENKKKSQKWESSLKTSIDMILLGEIVSIEVTTNMNLDLTK